MTKKLYERTPVRIIFAIVVLALCIITVTRCFSAVATHVEKYTTQTLHDVASQNAVTLANETDSLYDIAYSVELKITDSSDEIDEESISELSYLTEAYGMKRLGFAGLDGITHSTQGNKVDVSSREYFKRAMEGKCTISDILVDALDDSGDLLTLMSVPVRDGEGEVAGMVALVYPSEGFNSVMQTESFEGQGMVLVMNADGQIMVSNKTDVVDIAGDLGDDVLASDERNAGVVEELSRCAETKEESAGTVYINGEQMRYCMEPVDLLEGDQTWYVLSAVPESYVLNRTSEIHWNLNIMFICLVIIFLVAGSVTWIVLRGERKTAMRLAYTDLKTGGHNLEYLRRHFNDGPAEGAYLVLLDLSNFRNITIVAGVDASDNAIRMVHRVACNDAGHDDIVAHVVRDHFIIKLYCENDDEVRERFEKVKAGIADGLKAYDVPGVHTVCGVCRVREDDSADTAISRAQAALAEVKSTRGAEIAFYDIESNSKKMRLEHIEDSFEESLKNGSFEVWYQPKFSVGDHRIVGAEALVRWRDKEDGKLISPGLFIPMLEDNGKIADLDAYMFRQVCAQQRAWADMGRRSLPISVNLSTASMMRIGVFERYRDMIVEAGIDPSAIQIEITESTMGQRSNVVGIIEKFREAGVHILMDDFGTGYSSLSTLALGCFDTIKIDKSLIDGIGDPRSDKMLEYVIRMAKALELTITVEGVETNEQLAFIEEQYADDIQGFYFARPMPINEFLELYDEE